MTAWALLLLAGVLEVIWTLGLKHSDGFTRLWPTLITIVAIPLSFVLLALSLKTVPFGTAYAVWVGIGAAGVAATGIVLFGKSADVMRIACLCLILHWNHRLEVRDPGLASRACHAGVTESYDSPAMDWLNSCRRRLPDRHDVLTSSQHRDRRDAHSQKLGARRFRIRRRDDHPAGMRHRELHRADASLDLSARSQRLRRHLLRGEARRIPVIPLVKRLIAEHPHVPSRLLIGPESDQRQSQAQQRRQGLGCGSAATGS